MLAHYLLLVICVVSHGFEQVQDWYPTKDFCMKKCEPECERNHDWGHCFEETHHSTEVWSCECYSQFAKISDNRTYVKIGRIEVENHDILYSAFPLDVKHSFAVSNRSLQTVVNNNKTIISLDKNITQFGKDPCRNLNVNSSMPGLKFSIQGEFCFYTPNQWNCTSIIKLEVFDELLVDRNMELSPEKEEVGFSLGKLKMVKGDVKVGVYTDKVCLRVSSSVCIWLLLKWECTKDEKEIHCFVE